MADADLRATYLGLPLRTPLVVGSGPLTRSIEGVCACAKAGAGAVVLKSLFEEQLAQETEDLNESMVEAEQWHSEVYEYLEAEIAMRTAPREYLALIRDAKAQVDIPVIASINCARPAWWRDFAADVQASGADALELNMAIFPTWFDVTGQQVEDLYAEIVAAVCEVVDIPVAVKLPEACSSLPHLVLRLQRAGASGFVLFNRFYQPSIDTDRLAVSSGNQFSSPEELGATLRWTSLLAGRIDASIAAGRGVHSGMDMARCLLAGADAVQAVSVLARQRRQYIAVMLDELRTWMETHGFASLADFRGRLSQAQNPNTSLFGRFQYMRGLYGRV